MKGTSGLDLVKPGIVLRDIPTNWRDHIQVITGRRRKTLPKEIKDIGQADTFEQLAGQRVQIAIDKEHQRLIDYLESTDALWWWNTDQHMLVTHTIYLKEAYEAETLKGIFKTNSKGKESGHDQNCSLFS